MDKHLERLIDLALEEDIGTGDVTSLTLIPDGAQAVLHFAARQPTVACGGQLAALVYAKIDTTVRCEALAADGIRLNAGDKLASASGNARSLLTGERVALNLMQRACGVAALTRSYVDAVDGTGAVILDTRKTMPGMRRLDKAAVLAGGGRNHRMGLWDMVLVKDNHIQLAGGIALAVRIARQEAPGIPVVVECDRLEQVKEALAAKPERILLDNMTVGQLRQAVAMAEGRMALEASGGVSLEAVRAIAQTGVGFISVGRLTHSAPAADIGADIAFETNRTK